MKSKFTILLFSLILSVYLISCIDIDNSVLQPVDYRAFVKFVNLKVGSTIKVNVDGTDKVTALGFGEATAYFDLSAGSRVFAFGPGDSLRRTLISERKYSVFYIGRGSDSVIFADERNTFDSAFPNGKAVVRFLHLSPNLGTVRVIVNFAGKDSVFPSITFKGGTPYLEISSFPIRYTVISGTDTLIKAWDSGISSAGRYSVVVYGLRADLQKKFFKED